MKPMFLAAAVALAACMPQAPQQQTQAQPQAQQQTQQQQGSAAATPPAASDKPGADVAVETRPVLDRNFLVGRWGDNGDCTKDIVLNADGSFRSYTGGEGQWSIEGNRMRMAGKADALEAQVELIDQNTIRVTNADGSVGTSQRCT